MSPVRVLVVDDQEPFRQVAIAVVEATADFAVAAVASSAEESIRIASATPIDLVLMDVNMPGMDGIEAAAVLARLAAPPCVLLLSTYDGEEISERLNGAPRTAVYLSKASFSTERLLTTWTQWLRARPGHPASPAHAVAPDRLRSPGGG